MHSRLQRKKRLLHRLPQNDLIKESNVENLEEAAESKFQLKMKFSATNLVLVADVSNQVSVSSLVA